MAMAKKIINTEQLNNFLRGGSRQISEPKIKEVVVNIVFLRMVDLLKKILAGKNPKVEYKPSGITDYYQVSDELSLSPLLISWERSTPLLRLEYDGLSESIQKGETTKYISLLNLMHTVFEESKISKLEEDLKGRS